MSKTISKTNKYKKFRDFYEEDDVPRKSKPKLQESRKHKDKLRHELKKGNFNVVDEFEDYHHD